MLLELLEERFGKPTEQVRERLELMDVSQLTRLTRQIIAAKSLQELGLAE